MANRARGETALTAGGQTYRLCLTLGALAEIEDGLGLNDLSEIETRLAHLRAADLAIVAAALMRGGGCDVSPLDVLRLPAELHALVAAVTAAFAAASAGHDAGGARDESVRPFSGAPG
jgi:hypothetical protein